jgi:hypothetical protein
MKVTVKKQPKEFKPVTLEIKLESREELERFHSIHRFAPTDFSDETKDILKDEGFDLHEINKIATKIHNLTYNLVRKLNNS